MNLSLTSRWSKPENDRHTYLVATISASNEGTDATATQIYLDIQVPEGVRIRHIDNLPTDGHGSFIGIDVPDLGPGDYHKIVFRVKSRRDVVNEIAPELHLHWIDSASGDLLERHQAGSPMPTEPTEIDEELVEILASTNSTRRSRRQVMEGHERIRHRDQHGKGHVHRAVREMHERIDQLERRMRRMQWKAHRKPEPEFRRACSHDSHHMHNAGRRMGRMAHRAFAASHAHRDDRHLDA